MTDKKLLATIAQQFDLLDIDDATTYETVICNLLVDHGYLEVEAVQLPDDDSYSRYKF
jgi:hypothetical protein|tara:strand:- start:58 stop:231 length:174 start_codon:yes stop_codon:yes gene_type:complete